MSTSDSARYHACPNGHLVPSGSTLCSVCGEPVSDSPTRTKKIAVFGATWAVVWIVTSVIVAIIGAVVAAIVVRGDPAPPNGNPGSGFFTACGGIAQAKVELNRDYPDSHAIVCFTVTEEVTATIGATASGDGDLTLEIRGSDGTLVASNDDTNGYNPEITTVLQPGTYVASIGLWGGGQPGPFTFSSWTVPSGNPSAGPTPSASVTSILPDMASCGTPEVPLLVAPGTLSLGDATPYACVRIANAGFIKFGDTAAEGNPADLWLAVHSFDESGHPVFIRSVDDMFGTDPELSLDLEPNLYLVETFAREGTALGDFALYVEGGGSFHLGDVSPAFSSIRRDACTSHTIPSIAIGQTYTTDVTAGPFVCLTLNGEQRLVLQAASSTQDLTLEVIGFSPDGTPVRYSWVDDPLWANDVSATDPTIDLVLPPGTYVLAAAEYPHDAAGIVTFTVEAKVG